MVTRVMGVRWRRVLGCASVLMIFVLGQTATGQTTGKQAATRVPEAAQPMAANADPSFEAATIKPTQPNGPSLPGAMGHRFAASNSTVRFWVAFAYGLHDKQLVGGPEWMSSEKFDIDAVADTPGTPDLQQLKLMIQKLLVDRFQLRFHREQREMLAYVLTVGKNGAKLTKSGDDPHGTPSLFLQPGFPKVAIAKVRNASMGDFTFLMQAILDRPMVDQTGLEGKYEFTLTWTPDETQFTQTGVRIPPPSDGADAPPLFTAVQEELGLKLDAKKAPIEVMVVDGLEKPLEN